MTRCEIYRDSFEFSTPFPALLLSRMETNALFRTSFEIILFQASAQILRNER
jgi:hypothetical protein